MPKVRVSALRFSSLLTNRNLKPSDVATRAKTTVSPDELLTTDLDVEFDDLVTLAKLFKRPWSYLLVDAAEPLPEAGEDNRTFANQEAALSTEILLELQAADLMLDASAELFPDAILNVPVVTGQGVSISRLAREMRAFLDVSIEDQLAIKDEFSALRRWIAAIHSHDVYVSQRRLKDPTVRAFSKIRGRQAIIVVDTGDTAYARIFSILHEFCHVTLRSTGICDLDDHSAIEQYCNAVAAEVLLPNELLDQTITAGALTGSDEAADETLKRLSRQLHVSQAALLIRLRDHGTIPQVTYERIETRRTARRVAGKRSGGKYYPSAINRVGRLFAHRVVDAVSDETIDRQDASILLGVSEHLVDRFTTELVKGD